MALSQLSAEPLTLTPSFRSTTYRYVISTVAGQAGSAVIDFSARSIPAPYTLDVQVELNSQSFESSNVTYDDETNTITWTEDDPYGVIVITLIPRYADRTIVQDKITVYRLVVNREVLNN